ncbi:hypothetical protein FRC14_008046 [Serendipita sp. 396]|nr:hypothetical protein FRC14_008046 [Serendipita sp. 396]KAG8847755.1 hypothetical protein FRB91_011442 [Serendipita sp. 411]
MWAKCPKGLHCLVLSFTALLISFTGVVTADEPQFKALTPPFDLATNQHDALALKPVARALGAVRAALKSLEEYYAKLQLSLNPALPSRGDYKSRDGSRVEFNYEKRLDNDKLLFCVLNKQNKQDLVVKYTQKYSEETHTHCASHRIARELYVVEMLGSGWIMAVTEYLEYQFAYSDHS